MHTNETYLIKRLITIIIVLCIVCIGIFAYELSKNRGLNTGQPGMSQQLGQTEQTDKQESVVGCYMATTSSGSKASTTAKDLYTLNIQSQIPDAEKSTDLINVSKASGTLAFKNFQKDSSTGTFNGTYTSIASATAAASSSVSSSSSSSPSFATDVDNILLADYTFQSEGTTSVMQVIFKKVGNDFVRGYGPMNKAGDRFANLNSITYNASSSLSLFKKVECPA